MENRVSPEQRIVITGIGLTAPNGNNLADFRRSLLEGKSGVRMFETRYMGEVPAGEVTLNMKITGPHYTIGAACAAGNMGVIQGLQMLRLGEVDLALAGGISESIRTFGIFASFESEGALARHEDPTKASRPFDVDRNGIVCSEGGCIYTLERLPDAEKRGAKIVGEVVGYAINSDAHDFILPEPVRQAECIRLALKKAGLQAGDMDILNTHATATKLGDIQEYTAIKSVFEGEKTVWINNTKSFIGHTMGAAGTLELAGNLPAFEDNWVHPTINLDTLDPECALENIVVNEPKKLEVVNYIMNNSFGMFGINSVLIVKRFRG